MISCRTFLSSASRFQRMLNLKDFFLYFVLAILVAILPETIL
jgi:hypothetical protein